MKGLFDPPPKRGHNQQFENHCFKELYIGPDNPNPQSIPKRIEKIGSHRDEYAEEHSSIT